jgi:hypothetical protein
VAFLRGPIREAGHSIAISTHAVLMAFRELPGSQNSRTPANVRDPDSTKQPSFFCLLSPLTPEITLPMHLRSWWWRFSEKHWRELLLIKGQRRYKIRFARNYRTSVARTLVRRPGAGSETLVASRKLCIMNHAPHRWRQARRRLVNERTFWLSSSCALPPTICIAAF